MYQSSPFIFKYLLTLRQCISYSFAALVRIYMLLRKHKDKCVKRVSILLGLLAFLIAVVCFLYSTQASDCAFPPDTRVCTTLASHAPSEQLNVSVQPVFEKVSQHRIRHKQLKSFLKKAKAEASSCITASWNTLQSIPILPDILIKPGYYLFLFRLTLF